MFNSFNNKEIKDIAPTQTANCGNSYSSAAVLISEDGTTFMRIRKLTPLECWRLMGFDDEDYEKASKVNSNTQLYKQAGNSIVVNVLEAILKNLLK
jgi:DNA (cytosine-5)-methyltransferase 1